MKIRTIQKTSLVLALGLGLGSLLPLSAQATVTESCVNDLCTVQIAFSGSLVSYQPPSNAVNLSFELFGAQGGRNGGAGGKTVGSFLQTPQQLFIAVGGAGVTGSGATGGFNGGGQAGFGSGFEGSGGGASDIRIGEGLEDRIAVAGGGGGRGAGLGGLGGIGGGLSAAAGKTGAGEGGGGGNQIAGGSGGAPFGTGTAGVDGEFGQGGSGGSSTLHGGGGGGGGYFGGGGGGSDTDSCCNDGGGGGGGSSYSDPEWISNPVYTTGSKTGNGLAILRFQLIPQLLSMQPLSQYTNLEETELELSFASAVTDLTMEDFELLDNQAGCQLESLEGAEASYTLRLTGCAEGELVVALRSNSVATGQGVGPAEQFAAAAVIFDRTPPELRSLSFDAVLGSLEIEFSEAIAPLLIESLVLQSSEASCIVLSLSALAENRFLIELVGCTEFELLLKEGAVSDLAGNSQPGAISLLMQASQLASPGEFINLPEAEAAPSVIAKVPKPKKRQPAAEPKSQSQISETFEAQEQAASAVLDELPQPERPITQAAQTVIIPPQPMSLATSVNPVVIWLMIIAVIGIAAGIGLYLPKVPRLLAS
jgi:hypothetical protein